MDYCQFVAENSIARKSDDGAIVNGAEYEGFVDLEKGLRVPAPPGGAKRTNEINVGSTFFDKIVKMGAPRKFGVKSDTEKFGLRGGVNALLAEGKRRVRGVN